jgi:NADH-quinone oxidoreductase subunit F
VDLHFTSATATAEERAAVDTALGDLNGRAGRDRLLPLLHAVNDRIGWISPGALNYVSDRLQVAPADAYGVATFYALFSTTQRPRRVVHVCDDIACMVAGMRTPDESNDGAESMLVRTPCLGLCDRAPAALITEAGDPPKAEQLAPIDGGDASLPPHIGGTQLRLLRRVGRVDPESLDAYRNDGGYLALRASLELGQEGTIAEIIASDLTTSFATPTNLSPARSKIASSWSTTRLR